MGARYVFIVMITVQWSTLISSHLSVYLWLSNSPADPGNSLAVQVRDICIQPGHHRAMAEHNIFWLRFYIGWHSSVSSLSHNSSESPFSLKNQLIWKQLYIPRLYTRMSLKSERMIQSPYYTLHRKIFTIPFFFTDIIIYMYMYVRIMI